MLTVKTRNSTYDLTQVLDSETKKVKWMLNSDNPKYPELEVVNPDMPLVGYYWTLRIEPACAARLGRKSHLITSTVQSFKGTIAKEPVKHVDKITPGQPS